VKCINKTKYKVFSKEGEVMEFADQKRIRQGCSSSTHIIKYFHRWHYTVYE